MLEKILKDSDERQNAANEGRAEQTRQRILQAGFEEMYENGFQGMRIDAILNKTSLAKGALYHHFPNKKALGYAVVDEVIAGHSREVFSLLERNTDPVEAICSLLQDVSESTTVENITLGCPVNNLVQEMAGLDEGFKQRLSSIFESKIELLSSALKRGQEQGQIKKDIDPLMVAGFIVSSFNGIVGAAKCTADVDIFRSLVSTLSDYVISLKP